MLGGKRMRGESMRAYRHMETSWGRERLSRVRSFSNKRATLTTSSVVGFSPVDRTCSSRTCELFRVLTRGEQQKTGTRRTLRKNSLKSSLSLILSGLLMPVSRIVSCRNLAISNRTLSNLRFFSSYFHERYNNQFTAALGVKTGRRSPP